MQHLHRFALALTLALAVVAMLPWVVSASGGASFSLQPVSYDTTKSATKSYFVFDAQPGAVVESQVRVSNSGTEIGSVRLYAVDATTGQGSGTVFRTLDAPRQEAGGWIAIDSTALTLQPGESRVVAYTVTVPMASRPGQHIGGIVAENLELKRGAAGDTAPDRAGLQVNIQNLTILAVQINLPGPVVEQVAVTGVSAGGDRGYQTLSVGLRNEGTMMVKPAGTLRVTDSTGNEVQNRPLSLDTFLPQTTIAYPVLVADRALAAGDYRAVIALRYGSAGKTETTIPFTVTQAQVTQAFQAPAPLAPPVASASATTGVTARAQWPFFVGGGVLLVVVLLGGIFLGRGVRARARAK